MNGVSTKSSQRQFLVKVYGLDGYMMTKSGGNITADTTKVYDGGKEDPDVLSSPKQVDNVTVSRGFDRVRDSAQIKELRRNVGKWRTTVSVTPTDEDLIAVDEPVVYSNALLVGFTEMEVDASSGEVATYQLEFAVGSVT